VIVKNHNRPEKLAKLLKEYFELYKKKEKEPDKSHRSCFDIDEWHECDRIRGQLNLLGMTCLNCKYEKNNKCTKEKSHDKNISVRSVRCFLFELVSPNNFMWGLLD
jgi:hypothetical protein